MSQVQQDAASKASTSKKARAGGLLDGRRGPGRPAKPKNRSWGLVTLAALLVVACGLGVAAWGLNAGQRESVLTVREPVAKGHVIERNNLISTSVAGVPGALSVGQIDAVAGQNAATDLVSGQVLTDKQVTPGQVPESGFATVGLSLDPTRVPGAGLDAGDAVKVIAVPAPEAVAGDPKLLDAPTVLSQSATVFASEGGLDSSGAILLTLLVKAEDAERIAAYSAQGRVALIETSLVGG